MVFHVGKYTIHGSFGYRWGYSSVFKAPEILGVDAGTFSNSLVFGILLGEISRRQVKSTPNSWAPHCSTTDGYVQRPRAGNENLSFHRGDVCVFQCVSLGDLMLFGGGVLNLVLWLEKNIFSFTNLKIKNVAWNKMKLECIWSKISTTIWMGVFMYFTNHHIIHPEPSPPSYLTGKMTNPPRVLKRKLGPPQTRLPWNMMMGRKKKKKKSFCWWFRNPKANHLGCETL